MRFGSPSDIYFCIFRALVMTYECYLSNAIFLIIHETPKSVTITQCVQHHSSCLSYSQWPFSVFLQICLYTGPYIPIKIVIQALPCILHHIILMFLPTPFLLRNPHIPHQPSERFVVRRCIQMYIPTFERLKSKLGHPTHRFTRISLMYI